MSRESAHRRPLAVFDIDNTLSDTDHRQHFLERRPRDWDGFFGAAPADPPLARGVALAVESAADCEVVYLTGRPSAAARTPSSGWRGTGCRRAGFVDAR